MIWVAVLLGAAGCYVCKVAGLSVPEKVLNNPRVMRVATALPLTLLAALVATQTFTSSDELVLDARATGAAVAIVAVLLRAPFLLVVILASVTAALIRAFT